MARIAGVDLPRDKRIEVGLTAIFGVGRSTASQILERTGISPATRVRDLSDSEVSRLRQVLEHELKDAFDGVSWQVSPEAAECLPGLPALSAEVIFYAAREAMRNAALHARPAPRAPGPRPAPRRRSGCGCR